MSAVLVAYATKYGSTREVAEAVGVELHELGIDAEVRPAGEVRDLEGYSAVVLGGALFYFRWHHDARRFLSRHHKALQGLPIAIFAMGPTNDVAEEFEGAREQLNRALSKFPWLEPASVAVFGGRLDPAALRFPDNNPAMRHMPASDIRDWLSIRDWAAALPNALGLRLPAGTAAT